MYKKTMLKHIELARETNLQRVNDALGLSHAGLGVAFADMARKLPPQYSQLQRAIDDIEKDGTVDILRDNRPVKFLWRGKELPKDAFKEKPLPPGPKIEQTTPSFSGASWEPAAHPFDQLCEIFAKTLAREIVKEIRRDKEQSIADTILNIKS